MFFDILSRLKEYWLFVLVYFIFIGFAYQFSYWKSFGLNGISMINFYDVLKSSFSPLIKFLLPLFALLFVYFAISFSWERLGFKVFFLNQSYENLTKRNFDLWVLFILVFGGLFLILQAVYTKELLPSIYIFIMAPKGLAHAITASFFKSKPYGVFFIIMYTFQFLPIISLFSGKHDAEEILRNKHYMYIVNKEMLSSLDTVWIESKTKTKNCHSRDSLNSSQNKSIKDSTSLDTYKLKFIGNTDNSYVFTDMDNKAIFIVKKEKFEALILQEYDEDKP